MMHFARMVHFLQKATSEFTLAFGSILSWPLWMPVLLVGSVIGLIAGRSDAVMVILTIQTSIDAQATKTLQSHVRAQDERRDAMMQEQLEASAAVLVEVRGMADRLIDMMHAAEARDRLSAKRDKMILTALESRGDFYDFITRGGDVVDSARKAARRTGPPGKAHGRPNRARS